MTNCSRGTTGSAIPWWDMSADERKARSRVGVRIGITKPTLAKRKEQRRRKQKER